MSSPAEQPSLILIQRLAGGRVEWIPLEVSPKQVAATPEAAYTLIDRANYEAPQMLVAQRVGEDLVVRVQGTQVLVLDGFFATAAVTFYPTTNIASGAGPFSSAPLTPDSPVQAGSPAGEQVVWSAGKDDSGKTGDDESSAAGAAGGGSSPMLWVGLAAGGLGLLALAGGGGGSGGGESGGSGTPIPPGAPTPDTVAPTITSGATAAAIAENSGVGQVVYTATATDTGTITYSLKAGGDAAAFTMNPSTGAVTLTVNPDFETKSSYNFTVVATDAAGNSSERAVSLAINNVVDETPPEVDHIALTSAVGAQNGILNAGDTVSVTVTMTENTVVDTSGGTPSIELSIGNDRVDAGYVSGSGTTSLIFEYTIQPGDDDSNGISIPPNRLDRNGGSIADVAGNAAILGHDPVGNNSSFVVDTTAPTLSSSTPADNANDVPLDADIVLRFDNDVHAGSGNIILSSVLDTRTINVTDGSQVSISGNQVTVDPTIDLIFGATYSVQIAAGALTDSAGNPYAGISNTTTLNFETVAFVFEPLTLAQGSNSDSSRTFQSAPSKDIDIRVASDDTTPSAVGSGSAIWSGAGNLGSDDRVTLIGAAPANPVSITDAAVAWQSGSNAGPLPGNSLAKTTPFDSSMPDPFLDGGGQAHIAPLTNIDAAILTSQGLA